MVVLIGDLAWLQHWVFRLLLWAHQCISDQKIRRAI